MQQCILGNQPLECKISFALPAAEGPAKQLTQKFYYLSPGAGIALISTFKTAWEAVVAPAWKASLSVQVPAPLITIRDLTLYANQQVTFLPGVNAAWGPGAVGADALPPGQNVYFEKITGLRGKTNRGSLHLPGVDETSTLSGDLTAGAKVLFNALSTALCTNVVAGGFTFVPQLYSPSLSNQRLGTVGIWMQVLTGMLLSGTITGMKRRKQKNQYP
jgi:hypothetical protein